MVLVLCKSPYHNDTNMHHYFDSTYHLIKVNKSNGTCAFNHTKDYSVPCALSDTPISTRMNQDTSSSYSPINIDCANINCTNTVTLLTNINKNLENEIKELRQFRTDLLEANANLSNAIKINHII